MKNYTKIQYVEFTVGTDISDAAKDAVELARREECIAKFDFNGIELEASEYTSSNDLVSLYHLELKESAESAKSPMKFFDGVFS